MRSTTCTQRLPEPKTWTTHLSSVSCLVLLLVSSAIYESRVSPACGWRRHFDPTFVDGDEIVALLPCKNSWHSFVAQHDSSHSLDVLQPVVDQSGNLSPGAGKPSSTFAKPVTQTPQDCEHKARTESANKVPFVSTASLDQSSSGTHSQSPGWAWMGHRASTSPEYRNLF